MSYKFLHTMIRVNNLEESINFYKNVLDMEVFKHSDYPDGKFTLVFLGYKDSDYRLELTYNWDQHSYNHGDAFGHIALGVNNIYEVCEKIKSNNGKITREPGPMKFTSSSANTQPSVIAFVEDPNGYKIELIQTEK